MKFNFRLVLVLLVLSCGCKSAHKKNANEKVGPRTIKLSGQVYFYAPEIDTAEGSVTGGCDCCSGNFLFLNSTDFIWIDDCEGDLTIRKGKYHANDTAVILNFDARAVAKNYNWEREADTSIKPDFFIVAKTLKPATLHLHPIMVDKKIYLKFDDGSVFYGAPDKNTTLSKELSSLKQDSIWEKLQKN